MASAFSRHPQARESLRHRLSRPSHPDGCETLEVCASQALVNKQDHDDGSWRPPWPGLHRLLSPGPPRMGSSRRRGLLCGRGRPSQHCPLWGDGALTPTECPGDPESGSTGLAGLSKVTWKGQRRVVPSRPWAGARGPGTGQGGQEGTGAVRGFGQLPLTGTR